MGIYAYRPVYGVYTAILGLYTGIWACTRIWANPCIYTVYGYPAYTGIQAIYAIYRVQACIQACIAYVQPTLDIPVFRLYPHMGLYRGYSLYSVYGPT